MSIHVGWYRHVGAALVLVLLVASNGFGWGQEGHQVVATIAEAHLTAKARAKVQELLGAGASLVSVANWADEIRPARPQTAAWHYIDISLDATAINERKDCPNGDCVTAAIGRFLAVLRDGNSSSDAKSEALKFIDHFVGDLHQPLHCEDNNDKGGNEVQVRFFGENSNLHAVWDVLLIEKINPSTAEYAARLNASITGREISLWERGTPDDWALESHAVARRVAYGLLPTERNPDLGMSYLQSAASAVDLQLERAGIRLAYLINQVFR